MTRHRAPTLRVGERILKTIGYLLAITILALTIFVLLFLAVGRQDAENLQIKDCTEVSVDMRDILC